MCRLRTTSWAWFSPSRTATSEADWPVWLLRRCTAWIQRHRAVKPGPGCSVAGIVCYDVIRLHGGPWHDDGRHDRPGYAWKSNFGPKSREIPEHAAAGRAGVAGLAMEPRRQIRRFRLGPSSGRTANSAAYKNKDAEITSMRQDPGAPTISPPLFLPSTLLIAHPDTTATPK